MPRMTTQLRALMKRGFLELPATYDPITARLAENAGFKSIYNGGFVTGGSTCISEPMLTMSEQIRVAGDMANAVTIPVVMDAGAGWGEPLHTMRTVRECIRAGIAGVHIAYRILGRGPVDVVLVPNWITDVEATPQVPDSRPRTSRSEGGGTRIRPPTRTRRAMSMRVRRTEGRSGRSCTTVGIAGATVSASMTFRSATSPSSRAGSRLRRRGRASPP